MPACPRCGAQNLAESRFCQSCGSPLQIPAQPATPPQYYYTPQPPRPTSSETTIILAVVLIVVIVGAIAAVAFVFYTPSFNVSRVVPRPGPVTVTGIFLTIIYPDTTATTGYFGPTYRFIDRPLLYLQHNQQQQVTFTLTLNSTTPHTIDTIGLAYSGGFTIQSYSPNTPHTMTQGASQLFSVWLQAPSTDYSGPVTIELTTH